MDVSQEILEYIDNHSQEAFDLLLGRTGLAVSAHPVAQTILLPWSELNILNDLFLGLSLIIEYRPLFAAR